MTHNVNIDIYSVLMLMSVLTKVTFWSQRINLKTLVLIFFLHTHLDFNYHTGTYGKVILN